MEWLLVIVGALLGFLVGVALSLGALIAFALRRTGALSSLASSAPQTTDSSTQPIASSSSAPARTEDAQGEAGVAHLVSHPALQTVYKASGCVFCARVRGLLGLPPIRRAKGTVEAKK